MITVSRRTTPLVAQVQPPAPAPEEAPASPSPAVVRVPRRRRARPEPRRSAGGVGWWGLSLILASLGVVVLIGVVTFERVGRRETAVPVLTAGLQQPTERLLVKELARTDGGSRVQALDDLVAFDLDRATALADPQAAARAATEERAVELYDKSLPADPGITRTELGISRSLIGVMSEQNHGKVAGSRVTAAIFALTLLGWCFVQAKDDNILLLPACALVGGWLLASAAKLLVVELLSGVNRASDTYVRSFEAAVSQPLAIAKIAAVGLLAGAVIYRFATMGRRRLARRDELRSASAMASEPVA